MKPGLLAATGAVAVAIALGSAAGAPPEDYAAVALNVLPPGQSGSLLFPRTATDQLALYDGLTTRFDGVSPSELGRYFKSARFGPEGKATSVERPRPGLRIVRDRWDVPHVYGETRNDVLFGAGWVTAADRGLLMNLLRGPGRISAIDAPGYDAFTLALSARRLEPTPQTEAFLAAQVELLRGLGPDGRRVLRDVDEYVAGINAYNRASRYEITPWTRNDVIAVATMIGDVFGAGGGDEVRSSELLSGLRARLGDEKGTAVWNDLRQVDDPESPVSVPSRFEYGTRAASGRGSAVVDEGSFAPEGGRILRRASRATMSNTLLIGSGRSSNGHPLFVGGPQTGHTYPQILMELDLHGGGFDVRGAAFPGVSLYVLVGRGVDYAWSATSAGLDIVDEYVETLCGGDDTHYLYRGDCRAMGVFDAGVLKGGGLPDARVVFRTTVHGPVTGYATVGGRRVAIAERRSTRGREILSAVLFADLSTNRVDSARSFLRAANRMEMTFNWLYADDRDIAQFTSGRLPLRSADVDPALPTLGTGEYEWQGWLGFAGHPQTINPAGGAILNWNNRPAHGFSAADDDWSLGSVQRVELLARGIAARKTHSLASVVSAMNRAATQDLRAVEVLHLVSDVLRSAPGGSPRGLHMLQLMETWRTRGASRLDRDLDGKIDDPGAAILDAAWPRLADAVMRPVLGPLVERLAALETRDNRPSNGNAYGTGWYGYVEKDLRALLGRPGQGAFRTRFCGAGDLAACRESLWAALAAAGDELAATQGPDPAAWRADATQERTRFGFLAASMRFANRPTFQQVVTFSGHRPR